MDYILGFCVNATWGAVMELRFPTTQDFEVIVFENSIIGPTCPSCGNKVKVFDGEYKLYRDGTVEFLRGPENTHYALLQLKYLAEVAKAQSYTPEQFLKEIQKLGPVAKKILEEPAIKKKLVELMAHPATTNLIAFLAFLLAFVSMRMESKEQQVVHKHYTFNQVIQTIDTSKVAKPNLPRPLPIPGRKKRRGK